MSLLELFKTFTRGQENAQDQLNANFAALEGAVIVDSGSNNNGSWTKFADGTMICFRNSEKQPVSIPPNGEWNDGFDFPQKFIGTPITAVEGFPTNGNGTPLYIPLLSILATGLFPGKWMVGFKNTSTHTITRVLNIELIAIGRWK